MDLPFDGAISRYFKTGAPDRDPQGHREGRQGRHPVEDLPLSRGDEEKDYEAQMDALQIQLVRMQADMRETGKRLVVVFEGRDAAGKGGTIDAVRENLNPRVASVVALAETVRARGRSNGTSSAMSTGFRPAGEIVLFDRSWYNRGIVEHVFGFCTARAARAVLPPASRLRGDAGGRGHRLPQDLAEVGRAEQLKRFLDREKDPLKQWKLSQIDIDGLAKWDDYTRAIDETLTRSHSRPRALDRDPRRTTRSAPGSLRSRRSCARWTTRARTGR